VTAICWSFQIHYINKQGFNFNIFLPNDNTDSLVGFCVVNGLRICSSWYMRRDIHWKPATQTTVVPQRMLILITTRSNAVQQYRVYLSMEFDTDHQGFSCYHAIISICYWILPYSRGTRQSSVTGLLYSPTMTGRSGTEWNDTVQSTLGSSIKKGVAETTGIGPCPTKTSSQT